MKEIEDTDNLLLFIYHCNVLKSKGYLEGDMFEITHLGFDRAMDLLEEGYKLTLDYCKEVCDHFKISVEIGYLVFIFQDQENIKNRRNKQKG